MTDPIQFTRYLYDKDEVMNAIIITMLNKNDECVFWAYELYYSGFQSDLVKLLWQIYYDFYATINPAFEKYLLIKLKKNLQSEDDTLVYSIINNFMIRPHNMDIFILRNIVNQFDIEKPNIDTDIKCQLEEAINSKDYLVLSSLILDDISVSNFKNQIDNIVDYFARNGIIFDKINSDISKIEKYVDKRIILLSRIVKVLTMMKQIKNGKNIYVCGKDENIKVYKTIDANFDISGIGYNRPKLPPHKILQHVTLYYIDSYDKLSLFQLNRDKIDITTAYLYNWLYHASYSPIWAERITRHNGIINHKTKSVDFHDTNDEETFYELYNLEPDEQKKETQEKSIQLIKHKTSWLEFYKEHNKNGISDVNEEIIEGLEKIRYM